MKRLKSAAQILKSTARRWKKPEGGGRRSEDGGQTSDLRSPISVLRSLGSRPAYARGQAHDGRRHEPGGPGRDCAFASAARGNPSDFLGTIWLLGDGGSLPFARLGWRRRLVLQPARTADPTGP